MSAGPGPLLEGAAGASAEDVVDKDTGQAYNGPQSNAPEAWGNPDLETLYDDLDLAGHRADAHEVYEEEFREATAAMTIQQKVRGNASRRTTGLTGEQRQRQRVRAMQGERASNEETELNDDEAAALQINAIEEQESDAAMLVQRCWRRCRHAGGRRRRQHLSTCGRN